MWTEWTSVVASHRHFDHYGGMERILRDFPVDLYVGNLADCPNRSTDNAIRTALQERNIPTQGPGQDTITVDGVDFTILPPDPDDDPCPGEENDNSVLVRYGVRRFLHAVHRGCRDG